MGQAGATAYPGTNMGGSDMGFNPFKEAEKKAKQAVDKVIKPATKAAEDAVWKVRREAWAKIMEAKGRAEKAIDDAEHEATSSVRKIGHEVEEGLTEKLPEMAEEAIEGVLESLAEAVTKEGLKTIQTIVKTTHSELEKLEKSKPDLVDAINELGGQIEIGPITLAYANFYTRTELVSGVLDQYINDPPELRRGPIIDMVRALGPDTVDLGISIQVVALVVGSKELGIGGGLNDISIELFTEIGDVILEKMGVPE